MTDQEYQKMLTKKLDKWQRRRSRSLKEEWLEAAQMLLRLNLDPLRPELEKLYSSSPRGRPAKDPVSMLRALILMTMLREDKITEFASQLRRHPRLATIAGFDEGDSPAVGTFYLFIDRLEDGSYQKSCSHTVKPSEQRKGKHLRSLKEEKAEKEETRKKILSQCDSISESLKEELLQKALQPRPDDFQKRLEDILMKTAVIPSAQRGLLGDLKKLVVSGDGSALETGASCAGKASCDCRKNGIFKCGHPRFYQDPTANWGYDSYRECFYFGHTFYQHCVSTSGHDLPVHIGIGQASESDFTLSLKSLDRLLKAFAENRLDVRIYAASYDAGHDGLGVYQYLLEKGIRPVIALNHRTGQHPLPSGTAQMLNSDGTPICPAGLEMRRHGKSGLRIYFNCPVKRPTHSDGETVWKSYPDECPHKILCQPDTKMGPVVYVRSDKDPRFYPEIQRGSSEYKQIYNLRTGCERSNAAKKSVHKLDRRPCRSASHLLFRLYLISIVEHAKAWLAEDKKFLGLDSSSLFDLNMIAKLSKAA